MQTNRRDLIDEMLRNARNIAVVGMSDKPHRASFNIGRYLAGSGYRVFPIQRFRKCSADRAIPISTRPMQRRARKPGRESISPTSSAPQNTFPPLWRK